MPNASSQTLETIGQKVAEIVVSLSYRIIDLFSEGLYSSPTKAVEELVANSYDAVAECVHVVVPEMVDHGSPVLWVADNGTGMDADGFAELWQIGESRKREPGRESKNRPPIGKFGIGKLATYVLARKLTYISKRDSKFRAVTMDFSRVPKGKGVEEKVFALDLRELTESEVAKAIAPLLTVSTNVSKEMPLLGKDAAPNWTIAAMSDFKPFANSLRLGRLKWVLSTALPLNPGFRLYVNDKRLASTREKIPEIQRWTIGKADVAAENLNFERNPEEEPPTVEIPSLGKIHGEIVLHEKPLTEGKSAEWGRSHGFFVTVRGRLINMDDALFGLPQLSHGPFARMRMVVHADGLDDVLRSSRETVYATDGVIKLQQYLQAQFNEVRAFYTNWLRQKEREESLTNRVGVKSFTLSRVPLVRAVRGLVDGKIGSMLLTRIPAELSARERKQLIEKLEREVETDDAPIRQIEFKPLGPEYPIALYNPVTGLIAVNLLHPFYSNYAETYSNPESFELIAVAEVLTEAYLYEIEMSEEDARELMERRDKLLRALVYDRELAAPLVVQMLEDSTADEKMLERAVSEGFKALGFEVVPISGKKEPDGIASARMGIRDESSGRREDYKITYDAKSTGKQRVKAKDLNTAAVVAHRDKYKADFALIVAPGFEGEDDPTSNIHHHAKEFDVTMMRVADFVKLIWAASTRQLGFLRLRELFETCRGPKDAEKWIDQLLAAQEPEGPLPEILEAIWELQNELPDPVKFAAVQMRGLKKYRQQELREWMRAVSRFAGPMVEVGDHVVRLDAPPERIMREVRRLTGKLPPHIKASSLYAKLESDEPDGNE